jgi:hypothetical protein
MSSVYFLSEMRREIDHDFDRLDRQRLQLKKDVDITTRRMTRELWIIKNAENAAAERKSKRVLSNAARTEISLNKKLMNTDISTMIIRKQEKGNRSQHSIETLHNHHGDQGDTFLALRPDTGTSEPAASHFGSERRIEECDKAIPNAKSSSSAMSLGDLSSSDSDDPDYPKDLDAWPAPKANGWIPALNELNMPRQPNARSAYAAFAKKLLDDPQYKVTMIIIIRAR